MDATVQLIEDLTDVAIGRKAAAATVLAAPFDRQGLHRHLESAAGNAEVDSLPRPPGRSRASKRLILKGGRFVLTRQRAVNQALIGVVHELLNEIDLLNASVEQERRNAAASSAAVDARFATSASAQVQRVDEVRALVESLATEQRSAAERSRDEALQTSTNELRELIAALGVADDASTGLGGRIGQTIASALAATQESTQSSHEELSKRVDDLAAELIIERHRREVLERELRVVRNEAQGRHQTADIDPDPASDADLSKLTELYQRFERFFRPTGVDLDDRFKVYLPDLDHLRNGSMGVIDIGAGRGDFLEVLRRSDIPASGVDTNPEAVAEAQKAGLNVQLVDAKAYLAGLDNESVGAITAFHVVEHLAPAELLELVDEIVRVLAPGGVVILETPNPTNLVVGASSFYHDPTHRRPLTPDYLSFLLRDRGLVDVQTRFLHPLPEYELALDLGDRPGQKGVSSLLEDVRWALKGPQDFAVVGRGPGGS
jgi:SAM-dependent methyltransferase